MDTTHLLFFCCLGLFASIVYSQPTQLQINQLKTALTALENKVNSLNASVAQLQAQNQALTTQNGQQQSQIDSLSSLVSALQLSSNAQQQVISDLQADRDSLRTRLTQVEAVNADQSAIIDGLVTDVVALQTSNQQLQDQVSGLSSTVAGVQAGQNAQDQRLDSLTDRVSATESSLQSLSAQVSTLSSQVSSLLSLADEVSSLRTNLGALNAAVAGLTADLAALTLRVQELQACCDRVAALNALLSSLQDAVGGLGVSVTSLTSNVVVLDHGLDSVNNSLVGLSASTVSSLQTLNAQIVALQNEVAQDGSTYVRWGRDSCPSPSSLVYSGLTAGKDITDRGSGSNILCLPSVQPTVNTGESSSSVGRLYPARYDMSGNLRNGLVPCAQCRTALTTTIVVPGDTQCPAGWTLQYKGRLISALDGNEFATEYICLDQNAQTASNSNAPAGGSKVSRLHYVGAQKTVDKVFACVVCSK